MSVSIDLYQNTSDNRSLYKSLTGLKNVDATIKAECELTDPIFILQFDNDVFNANYCYCENFGRYYFVNRRRMLTGGRIALECHVDVLNTYASNIAATVTDIVRQEQAGVSDIPDSLLPLSPAKQHHTMFLNALPFNLDSATALSFNFVLNVSGGAGGSTSGGEQGNGT